MRGDNGFYPHVYPHPKLCVLYHVTVSPEVEEFRFRLNCAGQLDGRLRSVGGRVVVVISRKFPLPIGNEWGANAMIW